MKQVVHTQEKYGLRPEAVDFPMMLVLSFAYPCNALCPHCPYSHSTIRKEYRDAPYMDAALFRKIADEAGQYGAYLRISGGGEPMLHPQATELLCYAKKVGCKIGLITNGSKFTEENSLALIDAGVDMIEFSVDALDQENYERVRKGLDWDVLRENVDRMLALREQKKGTSKIVASCVNQDGIDVDEVEKYWVNEVGIDYMIKRKYLTWGGNTDLDGEDSADNSQYLDTDKIPCPFIFERLNIDSRGTVMVCGYDISAHTEMGNANETSIHDIWHGPGFEFYRERHLAGRGKEISMCSKCPDWKYRSWQHNYWKVVEKAEDARKEKLLGLHSNEDFGATVVK
jgi:radical SAM protein with 4Fe4S-binding SPASM domain